MRKTSRRRTIEERWNQLEACTMEKNVEGGNKFLLARVRERGMEREMKRGK